MGLRGRLARLANVGHQARDLLARYGTEDRRLNATEDERQRQAVKFRREHEAFVRRPWARPPEPLDLW